MTSQLSAELVTLRAIATAMEAQTRVLSAQTDEIKALSVKVDDVQIRLIRVEEAKHGRDIERIYENQKELKIRLSNLELANASMVGQVSGANWTMGWIHKLAPWIAPLIIAIYLYTGGTEK
jgi:hypothetical protein